MTERLWTPSVEPLRDGALLARLGGDRLRLGPNEVHAVLYHARPGGPITDIEDLGISYNLITNGGKDYVSGSLGGVLPTGGQGSPATAISATTVTATGTPWTTNQLAGQRVYMPVTGITTPPVYMNIGSNTAGVITGDQWWTGPDGAGTTPASTNALILAAGAQSSARFMGITTDAAAAAAGDTALASEITTNGGARALAAFAHTNGTNTFTLIKTFSFTGAFTNIHKIGIFTCLTLTAAGILVCEAVLNQDATVGNGDTLQITETVTLT